MRKKTRKTLKNKSNSKSSTKKDVVKRIKKLDKSTAYRPLGHLRRSFLKGECLSVL
ncbi:MAG: hypothetical protein GY909_08145 [Oligoflexia bacterium]|nr:hypothetical protein [Oligoflexia bacterium]